MQKILVMNDFSPKWFYMWQVMIPIGIVIEIISFFLIPEITGYGIMAALFGISGKWLKNQKFLIKILFSIIFWFIGGFIRLFLFNHF